MDKHPGTPRTPRSQISAAEPAGASPITMPDEEQPAQNPPNWWSSLSERVSQQVNVAISSIPKEDIRTKLGEWGTVAGEYLDKADKRIEELENNAVSSLKTVSTDVTSFVKDNVYAVDSPKQEGAVLFSNEPVAATRREAQIQKLHTSPELYLNRPDVPGSIEDKKDEIANLQESWPDLKRLAASLVPDKISETQFWLRYFSLRQELDEQDRKRKTLLEKHSTDVETSGDWDSDEDWA